MAKYKQRCTVIFLGRWRNIQSVYYLIIFYNYGLKNKCSIFSQENAFTGYIFWVQKLNQPRWENKEGEEVLQAQEWRFPLRPAERPRWNRDPHHSTQKGPCRIRWVCPEGTAALGDPTMEQRKRVKGRSSREELFWTDLTSYSPFPCAALKGVEELGTKEWSGSLKKK